LLPRPGMSRGSPQDSSDVPRQPSRFHSADQMPTVTRETNVL